MNGELFLIIFAIIIIAFIFSRQKKLSRINFAWLFSNKKQKETTRMCSHCGSTDTKIDFSIPATWAYGASVDYECNKCGQQGKIFPEVEKDAIEETAKQLKAYSQKHHIKAKGDKFFDFHNFAAPTAAIAIGAIICFVFGIYWGAIYFVGVMLFNHFNKKKKT